MGSHPCGILQLLKGVAAGVITEPLAMKLETDFFLCCSSFALHAMLHMQRKQPAATAEQVNTLPGPFVAVRPWPSCLQMCLAAPAFAQFQLCHPRWKCGEHQQRDLAMGCITPVCAGLERCQAFDTHRPIGGQPNQRIQGQ